MERKIKAELRAHIVYIFFNIHTVHCKFCVFSLKPSEHEDNIFSIPYGPRPVGVA